MKPTLLFYQQVFRVPLKTQDIRTPNKYYPLL